MIAWDDYLKYRVSPDVTNDLRHDDVVRHVEAFAENYPDRLATRLLGRSVEGRSITLLTLGTGAKQVLAWSQMHGNEPTHTAALLDLINLLLSDPDHPTARTILAECRLQLILMLNPDGAERWTRRNAQAIDINRDALHLQSPEGQILRDAVETLAPDFALNLHNHRPHTTVGKSQLPAAFALLVPPVDAAETDVANVLLAKRLAGYLAESVAPHCPAPIARYDAEFMPRCFGEWVQQQGAATITIEAGGWSSVDAEPLVQLHFFGLVACLDAVATGKFLDVEPTIYEGLERTGEHDLFDKLLRGVSVLSGNGQPSFRADIGINYARTLPTTQGGRIVDLGDLHVTTGKRLVAGDINCLPGRIASCQGLTPASLPDAVAVQKFLADGVTTLLGEVDLSSDDQLAGLFNLNERYESPINIAFVARVRNSSPEILDRLLKAISQGVLAVFADDLPPEAKLYLSLFNFPMVACDALPHANDTAVTLAKSAVQAQKCAELLDLSDRGSIRLDAAADLLLVDGDPTTPLAECDLQRVIVGGNVVLDRETPSDPYAHADAGKFLRCRMAR